MIFVRIDDWCPYHEWSIGLSLIINDLFITHIFYPYIGLWLFLLRLVRLSGILRDWSYWYDHDDSMKSEKSINMMTIIGFNEHKSRIETWHDSFKNHKMIWDVSNKPQKEGWLIHGATSSSVIWNTSICDLTMKSQSNTPEVLGQLWRQGQGPRILGDVSIIDIGWYRDSCQLPVFFPKFTVF